MCLLVGTREEQIRRGRINRGAGAVEMQEDVGRHLLEAAAFTLAASVSITAPVALEKIEMCISGHERTASK